MPPHGDYDYIGEAVNLFNILKVKKVVFNCGEFNTLESSLIKVLEAKKFHISHVLINLVLITTN